MKKGLSELTLKLWDIKKIFRCFMKISELRDSLKNSLTPKILRAKIQKKGKTEKES